MYGNIISSNGRIELGTDTEKEIKFKKAIYFLSMIVERECIVYVNDDPDFIYLPIQYTQPFELKDLPIFKIKICRYGMSSFPDVNGELPSFYFSYYGYY